MPTPDKTWSSPISASSGSVSPAHKGLCRFQGFFKDSSSEQDSLNQPVVEECNQALRNCETNETAFRNGIKASWFYELNQLRQAANGNHETPRASPVNKAKRVGFSGINTSSDTLESWHTSASNQITMDGSELEITL